MVAPIPFNRPYCTGQETQYIAQVIASGCLSGNGNFSKKASAQLAQWHGAAQALLTQSGTAALEMAALLLNIQPGDEVIVPSYTFVSTASAFALRGATLVYIDIRPDTLNVDETLIEQAITAKTKAIVVVHYAGVGCEMDTILDIAQRHGLPVIEDNAHGILARYKGKLLGSMGLMSVLSFHDSKNIVCGEGGALVVNEPTFALPAEIIWEKGTNRSQFFRGEVDKYTWLQLGSSFLMSELTAAFLWAQLEHATDIIAQRMQLWQQYYTALLPMAQQGWLQLPTIPVECEHNAHLFYVLAQSEAEQDALLAHLKACGVSACFHYVPLHTSPAGQQYGRAGSALTVTEQFSKRMIRLPLWLGMTPQQIAYIAQAIKAFYTARPLLATDANFGQHVQPRRVQPYLKLNDPTYRA